MRSADLQNILRQSYDNAKVTIDLRGFEVGADVDRVHARMELGSVPPVLLGSQL